MGNELRQAYKAVCTSVFGGDVKLIQIDKSSKALVYCDDPLCGTFAFEVCRGKINPLSFKPSDGSKVLKLYYSTTDDNLSIYYSTSAKELSVKINIVFGSIVSFPVLEAIPNDVSDILIANDDIAANVLEIVNELATPEGNYSTLAKYLNESGNTLGSVISTYFDSNGDQHLIVPGGISVDSGTGIYQSLTVKDTINLKKYKGDSDSGTQTIAEYVKSIIETDYLYDGKYEDLGA